MDEKVTINGKNLLYGVLCDDDGNYQCYLFPGTTVGEIAFDMMVTIRLLMQENYLSDEEAFFSLIRKYLTDPQYAPVEKNKEGEVEDGSRSEN